MEFLTDAFIGVVLLTFPSPNPDFSERYVLIMFAIWVFINGMFMVTSGIMDKRNKPWFWVYVLIGAAYITIGFVIMNYNPEYFDSIRWLMVFMFLFYGAIELYLLLRRKIDYYPYGESENE